MKRVWMRPVRAFTARGSASTYVPFSLSISRYATTTRGSSCFSASSSSTVASQLAEPLALDARLERLRERERRLRRRGGVAGGALEIDLVERELRSALLARRLVVRRELELKLAARELLQRRRRLRIEEVR